MSFPMVALGEVLTERKEVPSSYDLANGKLRIVSKIGFNDGKIQLRDDYETKTGMILIRPGDIVVSGINAAKGAIALYESGNSEPIAATIHYSSYIPKLDKVDIKFLWWLLRSNTFREILHEYLREGIKSELKAKRLLLIPVPLPPLPEQRRIVARIEELAAKIDEAQGLRGATVEEVEALVNSSARILISNVNAEITNLSSWVDSNREGIQTGPFGAQLGSHDFVEKGVPILTIGNIQHNGLKLDDLKYVTHEKALHLNRYVIKDGDILFARMGTVGRCCVVSINADGWLINYHIIRVALDRSRVEPRYISWIIRASTDVENYLGEKIRGATRQGVNTSIVGSLPCRIPPLPEQRRIVAYLDELQAKVDALRRLHAETGAELDALMPAVLDRAFKGEL